MELVKKVAIYPFIFILYEITIYLANDMYLPSLPALAHELSITQELAQNTLTAWFLGASALQLILGPVGDRVGRRIVMLLGGVTFVISSVICAITSDPTTMIVARFFQGTAIASIYVGGYATIHEIYETKEAMKLLAIMGSITMLAPAFGPIIGAFIVKFIHWRYIFWLLAISGLFSTILVLIVMPESNKDKHVLKLKVIVGKYCNLLANRRYLFLSLSYSMLVAYILSWLFESPFIIIETYKKSEMFFGLVQILVFGAFIVGAKMFASVAERYNVRKIVLFFLIMTFCSSLTMMIFSSFKYSFEICIICMTISGFSTSMLFAPINRLAIDSSTYPMGMRTAMLSTIGSLGGVISGFIITRLRENSIYELGLALSIFIALTTIGWIIAQKPCKS